MKKINELDDMALCKLHSYLLKSCMEHESAEGVQYFREIDDKISTEKLFAECDKELKAREITDVWTKYEENNFTSLKRAYVKDNICFCAF